LLDALRYGDGNSTSRLLRECVGNNQAGSIDTMKVCYVCRSSPRPEAWSEEHVIPNALGGRWRVRGLLCRQCNHELGHTIDATLSKELGAWMNLLSLSRERGDVPDEIVSLEGRGDFIRGADGTLRMKHPKVHEQRDGNQVSISIQARSMSEARRLVEGYKRKYGDKVDVNAWMAPLTQTVEYVSTQTIYEARGVGSPETLRAVAKIAANAYLAWGGSPEDVSDAAHYIRGDTKAHLARWYFEADPLQDRKHNSVTHVIAVRGDPDIGTLWAYVELFRAYRFVVQLCRSYKGARLEKDFVYDLCTASTTPAPVAFNPGDLDPEVGGLDIDKWKVEGERLMMIATARSREQVLDNIIRAAFAETMSKHPEATTEDLLPILMDKITPMLEALLRKRDKA
jgi:hypothetical protein